MHFTRPPGHPHRSSTSQPTAAAPLSYASLVLLKDAIDTVADFKTPALSGGGLVALQRRQRAAATGRNGTSTPPNGAVSPAGVATPVVPSSPHGEERPAVPNATPPPRIAAFAPQPGPAARPAAESGTALPCGGHGA